VRDKRSNGALITILAAVVTHLQEKRAVTESVAAFYAFAAAYAKRLVDIIFIIWVLDKSALYAPVGQSWFSAPSFIS